MKQYLQIFIILLFFFGAANAQNTNTADVVQVDFSCPGQVTVTYNLTADCETNVTLYYSHNTLDWLPAQTVTGDLTAQTTGTGKTIIWNNFADSVRYGRFYFKVEVNVVCSCNGYVEINGVRWAKCNVNTPGTFTGSPERAGMFYQWNRDIGWSSTNPMINSNGGTVWDGSVPTGTTWEATNNPCPTGYRVPTRAEFQSLVSAGSGWVSMNDAVGRIFGISDNEIFLPAIGSRLSNGMLDTSVTGFYWSSTEIDAVNARSLRFTSLSTTMLDYSKSNGLLVRCVAE